MRRFINTSLLFSVAFLLASATLSLAQPVFTTQNKKDACNNLANGSFDVLVTSGTGPVEAYVFSSGAPIGPIPITLNVPSNVSGLTGTVSGRSYLIVVSDGNGSNSISTTIFGLSNISASISSTTNSSSCTTPNGAIDISVSGGSGSYSYSWTATNGFTSSLQDISGIGAGDYTVIVSDNGTNCTQTIGPITITQPIPPASAVLSLAGISPICAGQSSSLNVVISGGTAPYTLNITGIGVVNNYTSGTAIPVTPVSTTNYVLVSVADAVGCASVSVSGSPTITVNALPLAPAVTFSPSSYCVGATITAPTITTPTGGSTYTWYSDVGLTTVLTTGTAPTNVQLSFSSASVNTMTVYVKETNSSTCSGPATSVTLTVNAPPVVSSPSATLCIGVTMTASPTTGGTWISSAPGVATITNAGLITGVSAGSATFTFTATATGCSNTTSSVTVNTLPVVSVPSASLCIGVTMTASPTTGGTWISSAPGVATITNAGLITGISAGSATFTFTATATGCSNTTSSVTVNARPTVSTPSATLCIGVTMTASPTTGGTWISSAPGVATITNAGLITGVSAGSATFTFTATATGCSNTTSSVTVNTLPVVSVPSASLCIGVTMTASPTTGGTWISSAPGVATITNAGFVTALSAGSVTFTFTETATGCVATTSSATVNALPVVSTPSATLCVGSTVTASPTAGGTWVSNAPVIASIDNSGLITGISGGNATFTFIETPTGCSATTSSVLVNILPIVSLSSATLCVGTTVTASPGAGGSWLSNDPSIATIDNTGLVTGVSAGSVTFTFMETSTGCSITTSTVTIKPLPVASTPSVTLCLSSIMTANPTSGGVWVSSDSGIATIDNAGIITGISTGAVTFTFTETATGCSNVTSLVTVEALPIQSLTVGSTINPVCSGGVSDVTITNSESGVSYQLRIDADDSNIGSSVTGTGGTIQLSTGALTSTTAFNILAIRGVCSIELTNAVVVNVAGTINGSVAVLAQDNDVCEGSGTQITLSNSEVGVNYQLRNDVDDSAIGGVVAGTGGTISLPTNNLSATTIFNILASNGACSIEQINLVTVNVDINPDPSLIVAPNIDPLCVGGSTTIIVANSESGVSYQLRNNFDNSLIGTLVIGTGLSVGLPTGILNVSITYNVLATGGVCSPVQLNTTATVMVSGSIDLSLPVAPELSSLCSGSTTNIQISTSEVGVDYQLIDDSNNSTIGGIVAGTGGLINLPTGVLSSSGLFRVLATNGSCSAELTSTSAVVVSPLPLVGLIVNPQTPSVCAGTGSIIQVDNSEAGIIYQLRDDADDSIVSGAVIGNGNTIDLPTGVLISQKTFNVLAGNGACSIELINKATVLIDAAPSPLPSLVALDALACTGNGTFIQVLNTEPGIIYQLRDNIDNSNVSGAAFGNGATINLPTGPISMDRTFNVLASNTICSVQLSTTVSVTLRAINDPLCSNCSTVVVSTINPIKVTCGAPVPDGGITFQIEPPVPVVNIVGVKIEITGPTPKTQTNDFVFTGLAVGNYTYTVTYGDENNPECVKTGSFIIELSREADPIAFDLSLDEYDCLVNEGSVTLTNVTGATDTDFDFTITSNSVATQGSISKTSTSLFKIENLLLGDYQIQLSQNQQAINGCVGIVNSQLIDFTIAEPTGGCPVIIPNIFTPNGDGSNDLFEIRNLRSSTTLSITNRWGKEVFSSSDYKNDWTADNVSDGIYYYRLVAEGEVMIGWLEILR